MWGATAHASFYNSIERPNPPKCHPQTRLAILSRIKAWIIRQANPDTKLIWLNGDAGAGKSAIAQTMAEQCEEHDLLAASFFFGRSDPSRNDSHKLIATIAYQLCLNIPGIRAFIEIAIDRDPLIFSKSLASQMKILIVSPLRQLKLSKGPESLGPYVVIVDGLDECQNPSVQAEILYLFSDPVLNSDTPLLFLVASRPEGHITRTVNSRKFIKLHTRRVLDDTLSPNQDIDLFLCDSFDEIKETHNLRSYIPSTWPSDNDINFLVLKASGKFIYASVVVKAVKYVNLPRQRPTGCLDIILGLLLASRDVPFAELDVRY